MTDPEGEPIGGLLIRLEGNGESWGAQHIGHTEADGTFSFEVSKGTYWLVTTTAFASECLVEGYENPNSGADVTVAVDDGDIAGIRLTVSGSRSDPLALVYCSFPDETLGHIRGTVTDDEGQPVEGLWITANVHRSTGVYEGESTASDGTFHLRLRHGIYWLHIHTEGYNECTVSGYDAPGARGPAIFDTGDGDVAGLQVVVSGSSSESKVWSRCNFDAPLPRIEGTVLGPDGEPLQGISVRAWGEFGTDSFGPWDSPDTGRDGTFSIEVPDGSYAVELFRTIGGVECALGYADNETGHTFFFSQVNRIVTSGESVTGLTVQVPDTPSALCRPITGTVMGSDGESFGVVSMAAHALGSLFGVRANGATSEDGTFTLYAQAGTFHVLLATTRGSRCTVVPSTDPEPGRYARIEVTENGARDLHVVVSGEPSDTLLRFYCSVPPRMLTTELQPGWNLAGWTGVERDVAGLFGAIAGLEVVHAWDADGGHFLSAFHGAPDEVNSLRTLTPGMGLWLHIAGTDPVEWTRPLQPESGFVSLAEGWNLVSWSGEDGVPMESALEALDAELTAAAAWDTRTGQALRYAPAAPATDNTLHQLAQGTALWIEVSEERPWLQAGSAQPLIEYVDEFTADIRASLQSEIESVVTYFAHRFGVFVPGMRYVIGDHPTVCGGYAARTIFLEEPCLRAIAHEYSHAIQEHLAGPASSPAWITEGVANRWSAEYYDATGDRSYSDHIDTVVLPNSRLTPIQLWEMEPTLFVHDYATPNYNVAHLAIDRLVSLTGEDRLLDYYLQRSSYGTWQEAFEDVFDISVSDFYESFAKHREAVAPSVITATIEGAILGPDDQPLEGVSVQAFGASTDDTFGPWTDTATDGSGAFGIGVPSGDYVLRVFLKLDGSECVLGYYGGGGKRSAFHEVSRVLVGDADVTGIVIRIPTPTSELCRPIQGVVVNEAGAPLSTTSVAAFGYGVSVEERANGATAADGSFTLYGRDGTYYVVIGSADHSECTVSGYTNTRPGGRANIEVDGAGVTGLRIVVSGTPPESRMRIDCTFAE